MEQKSLVTLIQALFLCGILVLMTAYGHGSRMAKGLLHLHNTAAPPVDRRFDGLNIRRHIVIV